MGSSQASNLANHFLMAMPNMADPNFDGSVVLLAEHSDKGAMGLVINRAMSLDLSGLFERIGLDLGVSPIGAQPVLFGGPVQTDRGFVLHRPVGAWSSSIVIGDGVALTSSRDILEAVSAGEGPERFLVTLGYSGWGPGQLEEELSRNAWLTVPANDGIVFETPIEQRFQRAFALLGIDPVLLSGHAGHA
ncbi:MAG: YqgE/AlgH family protein [Burkholderiaceae bacterium]